MGHWGKVVGGAIGGLVGGPIGVAVGAGLGTFFDEGMDEQESAALQEEGFGASVSYVDDPDGRYYVVEAPVADEVLVAARLLSPDTGRYLRARTPEYEDNDGDFVAGGPMSGGSCGFYVPNGAVSGPAGLRSVTLELLALGRSGGEPFAFGRERFDGQMTIAPRWSLAVHWRPLIGLCMSVARADSQLLREEVRAVRSIIKDGLELPAGEDSRLKELLKEEPSANVEELTLWMMRRFPAMDPEGVLSALVDVAKADGEVAESEVEVIRRVALTYGLQEDRWPGVAEALGLRSTTSVHAEYFALLGIDVGATSIEIKRAYRAKVVQYHPDRVTNLAPEFRDLAKTKTMALREAYEALMARAEGGA